MAQARYISISLNRSSDIRNAIKELQEYKTGLHSKTEIFVKRLSDAGLAVAKANGGYYQDVGWIDFYLINSSSKDTVTWMINGHDTVKPISRWWYHGQLLEEDISPISMAEFGAAFLADVEGEYPLSGRSPQGVGRGTYSRQGHAWDDSWYWYDEDYEYHQATDQDIQQQMTPTHPMYQAALEVKDKITQIAKEVFGSG